MSLQQRLRQPHAGTVARASPHHPVSAQRCLVVMRSGRADCSAFGQAARERSRLVRQVVLLPAENQC